MTIEKDLLAAIEDYPDFPKPGIIFKDLSPVLRHPQLFARLMEELAIHAKNANADHIVGMEARGFLFGVPLAHKLSLPFSMARKKGKLPGKLTSETYALEYGEDVLEMQKSSFQNGARFLIVDDVIATGGTAAAVARMIEKEGATVAGFSFVMELGFLNGREKLKTEGGQTEIYSVLKI